MSSGKGLTVYLDTLRTKDVATYDTISNVLVSASKDCFSGTITAQEQTDILNTQKNYARERLAALGYSKAELDRMKHYHDSAPR